jgi:hypothetical protein
MNNYAFHKKVYINELINREQADQIIKDLMLKLFYCMKETNNLHKVTCEFFTLIFRESNVLDGTMSPYVMEMHWGHKKEMGKDEKELKSK